jgi:hypothetical protein
LAFITPSTVGLYDKGGAVSFSHILLPPETARRLHDALRAALDSPEATGLAAWPRELCAFPVSPQFRGKEHYISFHIDAGPKPLSPAGVRWRRARDVFFFVMTIVGIASSGRWLLHLLGFWSF